MSTLPPSSAPPSATTAADKAFFDATRRQARRAYERRRGVDAAAITIPAVLLIVVAGVLGAPPAALVVGGLGAAAVFAFTLRGLELGDGVPLGLLLGAVPVVASGLGAILDGCVSAAACGNTCAVIALLGGGTVGALLGERLRRDRHATGVLASLAVGALLAPMGCLPLAQGGLVGLAVGLSLGAASGFALARAH